MPPSISTRTDGFFDPLDSCRYKACTNIDGWPLNCLNWAKLALETLPEQVQLIESLLCVIFFEHFGILARVLINDELRIALVAEDDRVTCEPFTTKNQADPMLTYWLWRGRTFFESV